MKYVPLETRAGAPVFIGDIPGVKPGPENTYGGYGLKWANLSNTPFKMYKKYVHEGGIASPLIVHWPTAIPNGNEFRKQPAHIIDIAATCLDLAGLNYPTEFRGPKSLADRWEKPDAYHKQGQGCGQGGTILGARGKRCCEKRKMEIGFQTPGSGLGIGQSGYRSDRKHQLGRTIRSGLELYNMDSDRTENINLAEQYPEVVSELKILYNQWAKESNVLPLDSLKTPSLYEHPVVRTGEEMEAVRQNLKLTQQMLQN